MPLPPRIVVTLERPLEEFIKKITKETGIDRSNLIRMWIWEKMQEERDRAISEQANKKPRG